MKKDIDRSCWLKGSSTCCSNLSTPPAKAYRFILLGAPGVGKGTQAELISERLGCPQLSTGDVFRAAAKSLGEDERSPAINRALEFMRRGDLVPDEIVIDVVAERVACLQCNTGFQLDGYPRTIPQADELGKLLAKIGVQLDAVINYELPIDQVVARISGRRTCPNCKTSYHIPTMAPQVENICDKCGSTLVQREDDRPESIRVRMQAYQESTRPLIDYYRQRGLLVDVMVGEVPEETYQRSIIALQAHQSV